MTDKLISSPLGEEPSLVQNCHHQNQVWATAIAHYEQEIDQLLTLLSDLLDTHSYQNLRHRAFAYHGSMNHLKSRFQRLRLDMVCESVVCMPTGSQSCREPRFGLYKTIESHFQALTGEFNRVKAGCYQFLSVVVTLNIL